MTDHETRTIARDCEREAKRLRRQAERLAQRGLIFSAAECAERAVQHQRVAAQYRLVAMAMEEEV